MPTAKRAFRWLLGTLVTCAGGLLGFEYFRLMAFVVGREQPALIKYACVGAVLGTLVSGSLVVLVSWLWQRQKRDKFGLPVRILTSVGAVAFGGYSMFCLFFAADLWISWKVWSR